MRTASPDPSSASGSGRVRRHGPSQRYCTIIINEIFINLIVSFLEGDLIKIIKIHCSLTINKVGLNLVTFSFDGGLIKVNEMLGRTIGT